mmetsp:Transcript_11549/g.35306  ORF Transcript_11549/g.35306 Transcript_11549/m.35306 type:complete len:86 (-) Transcript_11549:1228-1485(-)
MIQSKGGTENDSEQIPSDEYRDMRSPKLGTSSETAPAQTSTSADKTAHRTLSPERQLGMFWTLERTASCKAETITYDSIQYATST